MNVYKRLEEINKIIYSYIKDNLPYKIELLDEYNEIIAEIEKGEFLEKSRNKYSQRMV